MVIGLEFYWSIIFFGEMLKLLLILLLKTYKLVSQWMWLVTFQQEN